MIVELPDLESAVRKAVAHYWNTLSTQGGKSTDRRKHVVGGKQMDEFCKLVEATLHANGLPDASVFTKQKRVLPGYFRATKDWDLIVVHRGHLVAAVEFKSQVGSFGNNFNNRTEEAIGNALDLKTAYREGAFGLDRPAPFLGWVMLVEDSEAARKPVKLSEPHFLAFPIFVAKDQPLRKGDKKDIGIKGDRARRDGVSYMERYAILLRRLVLEELYDSVALLVSPRGSAEIGRYLEPASDMTMRRLLAALAGHVAGYVAGLPPEELQ